MGVAKLAASVSKLMLRRFPLCADTVEEHTVHQNKTLPLLIALAGRDASSCIMGTGNFTCGMIDPSRVAILVRSQATRQQLRRGGLQHALILTVAEAKGLEFDLVVQCGLLSDPEVNQAVWHLADDASEASRVVSLAAHRPHELSGEDRAKLCQYVLAIPEMKNLYVAISRARIGCALLEFSAAADPGWKPLADYWSHRGLIERWDGDAQYLQGSSSCFGPSNDLQPSRPPVALTVDGLPSLVTVLQTRFDMQVRDEVTMIRSIRARGLELLAHALDEPDARRHVLKEACNVLRFGISTAVALRARRLNMSVKGETFSTHSAAADQILVNQINVLLHEASHNGNWRGASMLRHIKQPSIFASITSFLAATTESGTPDSITINSAQQMKECLGLLQQLQQDLVLGHAWRKIIESRFDMATREQFEGLEVSSEKSLKELAVALCDFAAASRAAMRAHFRSLLACCFVAWALPTRKGHLKLAVEQVKAKRDAIDVAELQVKTANEDRVAAGGVKLKLDRRKAKTDIDLEHAQEIKRRTPAEITRLVQFELPKLVKSTDKAVADKRADEATLAQKLKVTKVEGEDFVEHDGLISGGDDIFSGSMTIAAAKIKAMELSDCQGFCFRGGKTKDVVEVYFKSKWNNHIDKDKWTSFRMPEVLAKLRAEMSQARIALANAQKDKEWRIWSTEKSLYDKQRDLAWAEAELPQLHEEAKALEAKRKEAAFDVEKALDREDISRRLLQSAKGSAARTASWHDELEISVPAMQRLAEREFQIDRKSDDQRSREFKRACRAMRGVVPKLEQLAVLGSRRGDRCAAAGRAFLAARRPDLAVEAFGEAANHAGCALTLAAEHLPRHREPYCAFSTAWSKARALEVAGEHLEAHALSAAHCWLLIANASVPADVAALRMAAGHFQTARSPREAATCSMLAGDPRIALSHLGDVRGPCPTQLLLACALLLAGG